jgi:hypothetical protein
MHQAVFSKYDKRYDSLIKMIVSCDPISTPAPLKALNVFNTQLTPQNREIHQMVSAVAIEGPAQAIKVV